MLMQVREAALVKKEIFLAAVTALDMVEPLLDINNSVSICLRACLSAD